MSLVELNKFVLKVGKFNFLFCFPEAQDFFQVICRTVHTDVAVMDNGIVPGPGRQADSCPLCQSRNAHRDLNFPRRENGVWCHAEGFCSGRM